MSHHSGNYGGQCPSNPPTFRDKVILSVVVVALLAIFFGPAIVAIKWWVFG